MDNGGRPLLTLLCGVPASGKTRWVRDRLSFAHGSSVWVVTPGFVLISSDDRIEALAVAEGVTYQDAYLRHAKAVLSDIFADAAKAMDNGLSVVWDQTNLTVAARAERLALAPRNFERQAIAFEIDPVLQASRLADREARTGKGIPDQVLAKQRSDYVRPSYSEGFDRVFLREAIDSEPLMSPVPPPAP